MFYRRTRAMNWCAIAGVICIRRSRSVKTHLLNNAMEIDYRDLMDVPTWREQGSSAVLSNWRAVVARADYCVASSILGEHV